MKSSKPFIERYLKNISLRLALLLLLFFSAIFLFGYIINEVLLEGETGMDHYIFQVISTEVVTSPMTRFMDGVTYFASATFLQIAYPVLVLVYIVKKDWKRAIEVGFIGIGGFLVNYSMKLFFHRPRPDHPLIAHVSNFSFPSGHAMSGFIFYGLLTYLVLKSDIKRGFKYLLATLLILFSLLIGFSRIYLRLHYTSDVIAGFCIGFTWLLICIAIMERQKKKADAALHRQ